MKPLKDLQDEIKDIAILLVALLIGPIVIYAYQRTLPLWAILLLGFWYPVGYFLRYLCRRFLAGPSRGEDL